MNERIKSLIELAEVWNTEGDVDKCEVDLYKFGELIVRECINTIKETNLIDDDPVANIKKRFGVEE